MRELDQIKTCLEIQLAVLPFCCPYDLETGSRSPKLVWMCEGQWRLSSPKLRKISSSLDGLWEKPMFNFWSRKASGLTNTHRYILTLFFMGVKKKIHCNSFHTFIPFACLFPFSHQTVEQTAHPTWSFHSSLTFWSS